MLFSTLHSYMLDANDYIKCYAIFMNHELANF